MVWQAAVFLGLVIGIPIVVAALLGGKPKDKSGKRAPGK